MRATLVFNFMMNARTGFFGLTLAALVLTGCSTNPSASTATPGGAASTAEADPWRFLIKGTTAEQVRAVLGKPVEVRPMPSTAGAAEVWIYRRVVTEDVGLVPTRMEDIPAFDPMTGQQHTVQSPVYSQESRTVEEELQVLLFEGKVLNWKRGIRSERSYH